MQNFTLRIRGTKLFLLSFVLFMGGLSMYGQTGCPTTANTPSNQSFCYLQTVGDINTDGTTIYRTETSTTPIPTNELLENTVYYVGNADGNCTTRIEVTVNVDSSPAPVSGYGTTFSPALGSPADSYNVDDLIATLQEDNPGDNLVVFAQQYAETPLSGTTELIAENSYFVGIDNGGCPSARLAMRYDPIVAAAPTGDAAQTFCAGATVGDLEAQGTSENTQAIRWYSTATSNPNLDDTVELVDGETYYATQIINNVDSPLPPTESEDRLEVTVTVIAPVNAGDDNSAALCSNDAVLDLSTLLSTDADTDGTFTLEGTNLNGQFDPANYAAGTYTVTYAVEDDCTADEATFTITLTDQPEAPIVADQEFCETENPTVGDLVVDAGVLIYDNASLTTALDPSTALVTGTYYAVATSGPCSSVSTEFEVTVSEQPDAPVIADQEFCEIDNATVADLGTADDVEVFDDASLTTALDPTTALANGTYYAAATNGSCISDATPFEVTITPAVTPEAGDDMDITSCTTETIELTDYLSDDALLTGEFSGDGVTGTSFSVTTAGTYTVTYTVNTSNSCVTAGTSDSATFTITVNAPADANAGDDMAFDACVNESIDLSAYLSDDAITSGEFTGDMVTDGMFMATAAGTYTVTYTVDENDSCVNAGTSDSATFTITVNTPADANAGDDMAFDVCTNETIDLLSYLSADANDSGEFTGNGVTGTSFTATTAGTYTVTYTVDDQDNCITSGTSDSATFTITVNNPADANAGEDAEITACLNENIDLDAYLSDDASTSGEFTGDMVTDGMFMATAAGTYTVTYTVDENDTCVNAGTSDSATFTITVNTPADANAGEDAEITACVNENIDLTEFISADANDSGEFTGEGVSGTSFTAATAGTYTVTYSVDDQDYCVTPGTSDTATFTINVNEPSEAEAGDDAAFTLCAGESVDLFTYLSDDAINSGEFTGEMVSNGMFTSTEDGTFTITYTVNEDDTCVTAGTSDTATFTITVNANANAGADASENVCVADTTIDLDTFLIGADDNGTFSMGGTDLTDTNFDISTVGVYEFTYTVSNNCGTDSSSLTITVNEIPNAPSVTDAVFCAIEGNTLADLNITGNNLTFYSTADADPANMLDATNTLATGTYYATQTNAAGCESVTAAINVTVNDPGTPTIAASEFEICEYDERTVAYLTDGITSGGDITWYDAAEGGSAISESALLVDGMTYYASEYNSTTGCESAVRLAYTVNFTDCTIRFQEGISPNGDGLNDTFDIQYLEDEYPNYEIEIYNRWGNMVYKGNASTPNWDGTPTESSLGDDVLPVGVYFYVIEFNDGSTPARQGKVYLSR